MYDVRKNASFDPVLVHGLSVHLSALGQRESCFPGPHEGNRWLFRISDRIDQDSALIDEINSVCSPEFSFQLIRQIDQRCSPANRRYCQRMNVDSAYFHADSNDSLLSHQQLLELVHTTAESRSAIDIESVNRRSESLLMRAARAEIIGT